MDGRPSSFFFGAVVGAAATAAALFFLLMSFFSVNFHFGKLFSFTRCVHGVQIAAAADAAIIAQISNGNINCMYPK